MNPLKCNRIWSFHINDSDSVLEDGISELNKKITGPYPQSFTAEEINKAERLKNLVNFQYRFPSFPTLSQLYDDKILETYLILFVMTDDPDLNLRQLGNIYERLQQTTLDRRTEIIKLFKVIVTPHLNINNLLSHLLGLDENTLTEYPNHEHLFSFCIELGASFYYRGNINSPKFTVLEEVLIQMKMCIELNENPEKYRWKYVVKSLFSMGYSISPDLLHSSLANIPSTRKEKFFLTLLIKSTFTGDCWINYLKDEVSIETLQRYRLVLPRQLLIKLGVDHVENEIEKRKKITEIRNALYQNRLESLQTLLKEGLDPWTLSFNGKSPLHIAAEKGAIPIIEWLLSLPYSNIDMRDQFERTAIHFAIHKRQLETVRYLIEICQVDPNIEDGHGYTPLMRAAQYNRMEIFDYLLAHPQTSLNKFTNKGRSIIDILRWSRPYGYKQRIKTIYTKTKEKLKPRTKTIDRRLHLSHALHVNGTSLIKGLKKTEQPVELEYNYCPRTFHLFSKGIRQAPRGLIPENLKTYLCEALDYSKNPKMPSEILKRVLEGKPTLIESGYMNHRVIVLFHKDLFFICNRGACSAKTVECFRYDQKKLTSAIIETMQNLIWEDIESYKSFYFSKLNSYLALKATDFTKNISDSTSLFYQIVGNCSYAGIEQALCILVVLHGLQDCTETTHDFTFHKTLYSHLENYLRIYAFERWVHYSWRNPFNHDIHLIQDALKHFFTLAPDNHPSADRIKNVCCHIVSTFKTRLDHGIENKIRALFPQSKF